MSVNILDANLKFTQQQEKRRVTSKIILHHAQAISATIQDIHNWHLNNGWIGCGYHFYVRKDGSIYKGRNIDSLGSHCKGQNFDSIGICAEGNYMVEHMPMAQIKAIAELIKHVESIYGRLEIGGHKQYSPSECPGNNYQLQEVIRLSREEEKKQHWAKPIYEYLNTNGIKVTEERFDDNIKRGEAMALIYQVVRMIKGDK